jgi:hypothetical protein
LTHHSSHPWVGTAGYGRVRRGAANRSRHAGGVIATAIVVVVIIVVVAAVRKGGRDSEANEGPTVMGALWR